MLIEVFNPLTIERIGTITKAESIQWSRKFCDYGSFEIHTTQSGIKQYNIIRHNGNAGIILKTEESYSGIVGYGLDLNGLCKSRHITEKVTYNTDAESILKDYIGKMFASPADPNRKIPAMRIAPNQHRGKTLVWEAENINLAEDMKKVCLEGGLGYSVSLNGDTLLFDVSEARDKTGSVTFSREYKNLDNAIYTRDALNSFNFVYALGDDGAALQNLGEASGIMRWETCIKASGDTAVIASKLADALNQSGAVENVEAVANERLQYREVWCLGDIVSVRFKDIITKKQITEVREVYEPANIKIEPVFGEQKENIIQKVMKNL